MGRINKATAEEIEHRLSTMETILAEIQAIVPTIARLGELLPNLDRIGPRLDLIDEFGPRMQVIDEIGALTEPLKRLCGQASILDSVGEVMNRFLTDNHSVSESVRVDVETISALAAQVELFNRQILEQLHAAMDR